MSFGFKYASLNGNNDQETKIRWSDWAIRTAAASPYNGANPGHNVLQDETKNISRNLNGSQIQIGWAGQWTDRVTIGFKYTSKSDLSVTSNFKRYSQIVGETPPASENASIEDTYIMNDYSLPSSFRIGFSYTPRNIFRTVFNAEAEVVNWYETDKHFDHNVLNYSVGIEHGVAGKFPLRLGFSTETTFQTIMDSNIFYANKIITPTLSAGTGYAISDRVYFDFGIAYAFRTFEALDLFKDTYYNDKLYNEGATSYMLWPNSSHSIVLVDRGWENPDSVRETFVKVLASITYTW
jgi:long-subunit fatty acid transport protein